jgi:phosphohistidine swiveling domain-containing protein
MARFVSIQTNFSTGEIDPLLRARVDLPAYANALEEATNVVVQPQGGVRRRPGLRYISSLPNSGDESAANGVRLVPFEFSTSDSYMLCFTHERMAVFKAGVLITDINASGDDFLDTSALGLTGARLANLVWTQSADTLIAVQQDIPPVKIVRGATDADWTGSVITFDSTPRYAFSPSFSNPAGTLTPSAVSGKISLTVSTGTPFSAASVGQYINATPQGRAKIVRFDSATVVQAITEFPFFNTTAIATGQWELETGYEVVWSATKGYPRSVTFHEGRLYFGGSRARPSTIWGSKVGLFFDFEATEALDDDAVEATLDTNTFNAITDIQAGRDLQVFTTGGEFYCPQEGLQPITPDNFFVKSTTRNGSQEGIRVQQLESGTLFVQRQGKSLNEFAFTDVQLTYVTSKISLLSGHLLRGPTRMALRRSVATDENDLLLLVNGTDGSMVAFSLLRAQNVIAPSEFTTDGEFEDVGVDLTTIYVVVKRTVDAATVFYVERFDDTLTTDSAVTGGAAATGSAAHLVAKSVDILLDGSVQANQTVPGGGTVTFPRSSTSSFQIGLDYAVKVVTMPADLKISAGTRLGFKKRIVEVNVFVKDTQHLIINGTNVPFRSLDDPALLDEEVGEFTGTKTLPGVLGYSNEGKITIEQDIPLKMILLGLEYKISTYPGT